MPATFFQLSTGDVFKSVGGGATHLISIPGVDSLVGADGLAVYNSVGLQTNETIQYFLTFDDVIKFIHFGQGVGAVTVEGTMYCTSTGNVPGLTGFSGAVSGLRGKPTKIRIGSAVVTAVLTSAQVSVVSEPDTMANFAFQFSIINHQM